MRKILTILAALAYAAGLQAQTVDLHWIDKTPGYNLGQSWGVPFAKGTMNEQGSFTLTAADRTKRGLQDAARECLRRMGASIVEMEHNRDEEEFDGSFRLHAPYPQNMQEAPRYFAEYLPAMVTPVPKEEWTERFREHALSYCDQ